MSSGLSPEDRTRLAELFARAIDLPEAERTAFVAAECGPDVRLREELERVLEALAGEDHLEAMRAPPSSRAGTRIDAFELLERVGEGGMGEVYAAEQQEPVRRRVALKIIKPGLDSAQVLARFEAERQALARMTHPNIAQVFDGGTTESGNPYFVMEYVAGESITAYCDRHKLSTRARVDLFLAVCDGVQHAHQKGIIHRDLKPSNLLVAQQDDGAVPKIIDFGVARATTGRLAERTQHTMLGQIVGTLDYMSPEQADPSAVDIDTRSDIYSLGVVLYQLLSGLLPFEHLLSFDLPLSEVQRVIREKDPPTPSTRLRLEKGTATTVASLHGTDDRSLVRQLSGDLDWICMKALEKDPARRYPSASELAADLRRYLGFQPVLAGRPGVLYRAGKFVRRNRVGVAAALAIAAGACVGVYGYVAGRIEAQAATVRALRLSGVLRLQELELEADSIWPAVPERVPAMKSWLASARILNSNLEEYRATLEADARRSRTSDEAVDDVVLADLVENLERLRNGLLAEETITAGHGWSVPKRLAFARRLGDLAQDPAHMAAWSEMRAQISEDPRYDGLDLEPQIGLVPLGADPVSGLQEFAHLMTGEPAARGTDGKLVVSGDMGVVLVLIPGGTFTMGAQWEDEEGENYDPYSVDFRAGNPEGPLIEVTLEPFFLSKFEMTRGQWERATGSNPKQPTASAREPSPDKPVTWVNWVESDRTVWRLGLALPSEEQWEYAARAGETTIWSTGDDPDSLQGYANVYDKTSDDMHPNFILGGPDSSIEDHYAQVAPVGKFKPNPWGLHDVHGNVIEGCSNVYGKPQPDPRVSGYSSVRGGSAKQGVVSARSACRMNVSVWQYDTAGGLRPMRTLDR